MNKQFRMFEHECSDASKCYWYVEELNEWQPYQDKYKGYTQASAKKCKTLRAFRRNLKRIARKQPNLIGQRFRLISNWYEFSKRGNRRSLDIIMRVKG